MKPIQFISAALIIFSSCTFHKTDFVMVPKVINDSTIISYHNDIVPILVTYCYGNGYPNDNSRQLCHVSNTNQGSVGDFTTYQGLIDQINNGPNSVQSRVFNSNGGMPPSFSNTPTHLTDSDLQKFELWVAQGAKEN